MNNRPFLVTCGLPYTNGFCHLGHLRTYVPADFYVRFMRRKGEEVVFICGSDNHGTPVVVNAESEGISPRALCERYHEHFKSTFERMEVKFDHFGMTDDPATHKRATDIVTRLIKNGYVYPKVIQQAYCPKCKKFLPDRFLEGICPYCHKPARGDECDQGCGKHLEPGEILEPTCKICGTPAEFRNQEHYFFKLSEFKTWLKEHLNRLKGTDNAINYALGWINEDLHDWCITRTLEWGVKFPGRDDLVVYVWVDAPIGYIAFTEEWAAKNGKDWKDYWCGDDNRVTHFIGQDITYHHCVFWPAMLHGAGYSAPYSVIASGMVKIDDHKFSKSRGYVVFTNEDYLDQGLPADYLRYYLLAYTSHTKELNFSWKLYQERINSEVVNTLGNFIYRSLNLSYKKFGGVPDVPVNAEIMTKISEIITTVSNYVEAYDFKGAVDSILTLAAYGNNYIQLKEPWKLAKSDPEAMAEVLKNCLQICKALCLLIEPVMPEMARKLWDQLGMNKVKPLETCGFDECIVPIKSGNLPEPVIIFNKLDDEIITKLDEKLQKQVEQLTLKETKMTELKEIEQKVADKKETKPESKDTNNEISIEEFAKVTLKTGIVISAEKVPKSEKLLKLQINTGTETRQVVSGIAKFYEPEELVGKELIVVCNLKPAKIFGIESNGMILAAGDNASLLTPLKSVEPGTKIR